MGGARVEVGGGFGEQEKAARERAILAGRGALVGALEAGLGRLVADGRLPFRTGRLQGRTWVDGSEVESGGVARLVTDVGYAARVYYYPEHCFGRRVNRAAAGRWFDDFVDGEAGRRLREDFTERLKRALS